MFLVQKRLKRTGQYRATRSTLHLRPTDPGQPERDPANFNEAISQEDSDLWITAMKEELSAHDANDTWTVDPLPSGKKPVGSRWVFKRKMKDGRVDRFKARVVAKGFSQIPGIDFHDTFSPTLAYSSLRLILALAVNHGWGLRQLDVVTAFLKAKLPADEVVYMSPPPGLDIPAGHALRLQRCLYGLKQASHHWNQELHTTLLRLGFVRSNADPCIYLKFDRDDGRLVALVGVYVDDMIIGGEDRSLKAAVAGLKSKYEITDEGQPRHLLGITINYDRQAASLSLSQKTYFEKILRTYGMENCHAASTPAACRRLEEPEDPMCEEEAAYMEKTPYRSLVGALMFAMTQTRPDIAYAVGQVARYNQKPRRIHWTACKRILRYLKGTIDHGITYTKSQPFLPVYYCDADWAGDQQSRRSHGGFCSIMSGGPITWRSSRQKLVALSSCESELIAITDAVKDTLWLREALQDLDVDLEGATTIFEDNQGVIAISANNRGKSQRTKHISTRYFCIQSYVSDGHVRCVCRLLSHR